MAIKVRIPASLRSTTEGQAVVAVENASTVGELIDELFDLYPQLGQRLKDKEGQIPRHFNIYVDGEPIQRPGGRDVQIGDGQTIEMLPAVAGGFDALPGQPGIEAVLPPLV